jgi:hypothetical protein
MEIHMSMPKYVSIILAGLTAIACQAEVAIKVPPPEQQLEHPAGSSGATPSEVELKVAPLRLAIDLVDGSRIIGVPSVATVSIQTAVGNISLPFAKTTSMTFQDDNESVVVTLVNNDRISGVHSLSRLRLTSLFGTVVIPAKVIQKIAHLRAAGDVLAAAIEQKAKFVVRFDKLSASIGTIRPGAALFGVYAKETQSWEVWSSSHPHRPDYHYVYGYPGGG